MLRRIFIDSYDMLRFQWIIAAIVLFVIFTVVAGVQAGVHYDRVKCDKFATQTDRQTKFARYNYWSWDCLTPTRDGKWIPTSNLREFGDGQ